MAKVSYVGESEKGKEDRFALVECDENEKNDVESMLDMISKIGYSYDGYGDGHDNSAFYYVKVDDKDDYQNFMELWNVQKKALLTFKKAVNRYNGIMNAIGYEHNTIGEGWSEKTEGWNLRDMVAECDYVLSTYYEDGHCNADMRTSFDEEERKMWRSEVGRLQRFIAAYEPQVKDMICTTAHRSNYDNYFDSEMTYTRT